MPQVVRAAGGSWLTVGRIRYHFRVAGEPGGPRVTPLVLVHGLGVSSDYWARAQPLLAARRRVYAVDLPGFGRSACPARVLDSAGLAQALADWLAAMGLARAHLLGHSLGGQVVIEFARMYPQRVACLVLAAPTIGKCGPNLFFRALDLLRNVPREDLTLAPIACSAYWRAGLRRMVRTDLLVNDDDTIAAAAHLTQPLLIVRGTRDCVVDRSAIQQLLQVVPHASPVEIPGAAHALHWSHPRALAGVVNAFLAGGAAPAVRGHRP